MTSALRLRFGLLPPRSVHFAPSVSVLPTLARRQRQALSCNLHSSSAVRADDEDPQRKKESVHEAEYVALEQRRALRAMLTNMDRKADPDDKAAKASAEALLKKHSVKVTKELIGDLIKWKHTTHT